MYVNYLSSIFGDDLTCLSAPDDVADLWHKRLGYVISSLLKKLISNNLVHDFLRPKFANNKVCDARINKKQTKSSFK